MPSSLPQRLAIAGAAASDNSQQRRSAVGGTSGTWGLRDKARLMRRRSVPVRVARIPDHRRTQNLGRVAR